MSNTRVELALEFESGLTESAIVAQYRQQYGDDLAEIEVVQQ
jgi:hypothetical protein